MTTSSSPENIQVYEFPDNIDLKLTGTPEQKKAKILQMQEFVKNIKSNPNKTLDIYFGKDVNKAKTLYADIKGGKFDDESILNFFILFSSEARKTYAENSTAINVIKSEILPILSDYIMFKSYGVESFGGVNVMPFGQKKFKDSLLGSDIVTDKSSLINAIRFSNVLINGEDDGKKITLTSEPLKDILDSFSLVKSVSVLSEKQEAVLDLFFTDIHGKLDYQKAGIFVEKLKNNMINIKNEGGILSEQNFFKLRLTLLNVVVPMMETYIERRLSMDNTYAQLDK